MRRGFSLIELVVVMGILSTLIGIGVSSYSSSLIKSRDAKRKSDLHLIQVALEQYKQANNAYPVSGWVNSTAGSAWIPGLSPTYLKAIPTDPTNSIKTDPGSPDQAGNYVYGYYSQDNEGGDCPGLQGGDYYILGTKLENLSDHDAGQTTLTSICKWPNSNPYPNSDNSTVYAVSNP